MRFADAEDDRPCGTARAAPRVQALGACRTWFAALQRTRFCARALDAALGLALARVRLVWGTNAARRAPGPLEAGTPSASATFSPTAPHGLGEEPRAWAAPTTDCARLRGDERRIITRTAAWSSRMRCQSDQRRGRSRRPRRHAPGDSARCATEESRRGWARVTSSSVRDRCTLTPSLALRPLRLLPRAYATLLLTRRGMVLLLSPPA